jgi:hypothetical protein
MDTQNGGSVQMLRRTMTSLYSSSSSSSAKGNSNGKGSGNSMYVPTPTAYQLFVYSLQLYPWNWSCWLELATLCSKLQLVPPTWEDIYQLPLNIDNHNTSHDGTGTGTGTGSKAYNKCILTESCYWIMYHHFLTQYSLDQQNIDINYVFHSITILQEWQPSNHSIIIYKALAYFIQRDYNRSQTLFEYARTIDPHKLEHLDTFSSILHVNDCRAELSHLAHIVIKINKFSSETCCVIGNYYSLKG